MVSSPPPALAPVEEVQPVEGPGEAPKKAQTEPEYHQSACMRTLLLQTESPGGVKAAVPGTPMIASPMLTSSPSPPTLTDAAVAALSAAGSAAEAPSASADNSRCTEAPAPSIPPEFYCPISNSVMHDPVSTMDGEVFERAAIERWLKNHCTNPLTGVPLEAPMLVPNMPLARLIRASGALDAPPTAPARAELARAPNVVGLGRPKARRSEVMSTDSSRPRVASMSAVATAQAGIAAGLVTPMGPVTTSRIVLPSPAAPEPPKKKTREEQLQEWKQQKAAEKKGKQNTPGSMGRSTPPLLPAPSMQNAMAITPAADAVPQTPLPGSSLIAATPIAPQPMQPLTTPLQPSFRTNGQAPMQQAQGKGPSKRRSVTAGAAPAAAGAATTDELMEMLRSHNSKVRASAPPVSSGPAPRTHSVADIRAWEKRTGKKWANLTHPERWAANEEINDMINEALLYGRDERAPNQIS